MSTTRSGFVALVGRPNAGKSTLLNRLVGAKVAIVSDKPQTTRHRILGVKTDEQGQVLYIDTPGIHRPLHKMNVRMVDAALEYRLEEIKFPEDQGNIFLFLGSSIGNFSPPEATMFLEKLSHKMKEGDLLIVGYDLKKAERIMYKAYNDAQGLTAAFNLNLLSRLNREFGANFNLDNFKHVEIYNPGLGAMESYLLSKVSQTVFFEDLDFEVHFQKDEMIHTEFSYKYSIEDIEEMTKETSLTAVSFLFDHRRYFATVIFIGRSLH